MSTFSAENFNSAAYSAYRPTYGPKFYKKVYSYHKSHNGEFDSALDIATGTGQVSSILASTFKQVYAIDPSSAMLEHAIKKSNINYSISAAENLSQFSSSSIDLITVAQAAHWFNVSEFFKESFRVLKPNCTLAIWGYHFNIIKGCPKSSKMVIEFVENKLNDYCDEGSNTLFNLYRNLKLPEEYFQDIKWEFYEGDDTKDDILMKTEWTIAQFSEYLKTGSSYKNYMDVHPDEEDPVDRLINEMRNIEGWKDDKILHIFWSTVMILAKKKMNAPQ